jgi:hypothetical protein
MSKKPMNDITGDLILYQTPKGSIKIEVLYGGKTFWLTQQKMADLFEVDRSVVTKHIANVFKEGELIEESNVQKMHIAGSTKPVTFYSLNVIISVGYRVNSKQATQFRIWATQTLNEFVTKGFVLDDERLKLNKRFGEDFFDELLERIREIRASERRFYLKITDIYEQCSIDYRKNSEVTELFFKAVQNKLHWAVSGKTAAEIIAERANAEKANMGLTSWKNAPDGKILKSDVSIAKNYLIEK